MEDRRACGPGPPARPPGTCRSRSRRSRRSRRVSRSRVGDYDALVVAGFESPLDPLDPPLSEDGEELEPFSAPPLSDVALSDEPLSDVALSEEALSEEPLSDDALSEDDAAGRLSLRYKPL